MECRVGSTSHGITQADSSHSQVLGEDFSHFLGNKFAT